MNDASVVVQAYRALLEEQSELAESFCWSVLVGALDETRVLAALSSEPAVRLGNVDLETALETSSQMYDRDGPGTSVAWLIPGPGWLALLEFGGFAGSLSETLRPLAAIAERVLSMFVLDAVGLRQVALVRADILEIVSELDAPDLIDLDDSPELSSALGQALATGDGDMSAVGMATVEINTGARLDAETLAGSWPLIQFTVRTPPPAASVEERTRPESNDLVMVHEDELFDALEDAAPAARLAAQTTLIEHVLTSKQLDAEPVAVTLALALARGERPEKPAELYELNERLESAYRITKKGISDEGAWRRSRAAGMLFAFCSRYADPPVDPGNGNPLFGQRYRGWHQAMLALGDDWPAARSTALGQLRQP